MDLADASIAPLDIVSCSGVGSVDGRLRFHAFISEGNGNRGLSAGP